VKTSKEVLVFLGYYFDFSPKKNKLRRTMVEDFILFYFILFLCEKAHTNEEK
jgi:hypothetical protein